LLSFTVHQTVISVRLKLFFVVYVTRDYFRILLLLSIWLLSSFRVLPPSHLMLIIYYFSLYH